jgi:hypothetical protein
MNLMNKVFVEYLDQFFGVFIDDILVVGGLRLPKVLKNRI